MSEEGWARPMIFADLHYFKGGRSLCDEWGWFGFPSVFSVEANHKLCCRKCLTLKEETMTTDNMTDSDCGCGPGEGCSSRFCTGTPLVNPTRPAPRAATDAMVDAAIKSGEIQAEIIPETDPGNWRDAGEHPQSRGYVNQDLPRAGFPALPADETSDLMKVHLTDLERGLSLATDSLQAILNHAKQTAKLADEAAETARLGGNKLQGIAQAIGQVLDND